MNFILQLPLFHPMLANLMNACYNKVKKYH